MLVLFTAYWPLLLCHCFARMWVLSHVHPIHCLLTSHWLCSIACESLVYLVSSMLTSLALSLLASVWVLPLVHPVHCLLTYLTISILGCECCWFCVLLHADLALSLLARVWVLPIICPVHYYWPHYCCPCRTWVLHLIHCIQYILTTSHSVFIQKLVSVNSCLFCLLPFSSCLGLSECECHLIHCLPAFESLSLSLFFSLWVLPVICPVHCLPASHLVSACQHVSAASHSYWLLNSLCLYLPGCECQPLFFIFAVWWLLTVSIYQDVSAAPFSSWFLWPLIPVSVCQDVSAVLILFNFAVCQLLFLFPFARVWVLLLVGYLCCLLTLFGLCLPECECCPSSCLLSINWLFFLGCEYDFLFILFAAPPDLTLYLPACEYHSSFILFTVSGLSHPVFFCQLVGYALCLSCSLSADFSSLCLCLLGCECCCFFLFSVCWLLYLCLLVCECLLFVLFTESLFFDLSQGCKCRPFF